MQYPNETCEDPDEKGLKLDLTDYGGKPKKGVTDWDDGNESTGYEIDLREIDPDIKIIRAFISC